jgi:hypothetical protein
MSDQLPHLTYLLLCDRIELDEQRRLNVFGIVSQILYTDLPAHMPPFQLDFTSVVCMHTKDRWRNYKISYSILGSDGATQELAQSTIGLLNDEFTEIQTHDFRVTLFKPETFWFQVHLDGRLWGKYPVTVSYMPMGTS